MGKKKKEVYLYNGRYKGTKLTDEVCDKLETIRKVDKENGCIEDLKHIIYELNPSDVQLIRETGSTEFVEKRFGTLENQQTTAVAYMFFAKRLILGDSVGLGKTVEVAGLCNLIESQIAKEDMDFRCLLLTEKAVMEETCSKMIKFTGNYYEVLYGEADKVEKYKKKWKGDLPPNTVGSHSLFTSVPFQEYVKGFVEKYGYAPFDILIVDEAGSILTNTATKTYVAATYFEKIFDRIILLNATTFEKELINFYSQINFLDNTLLPTKGEFEKRYKQLEWGIMPYPVFRGKYKNQVEFRQLVGYRYLQRTRKSLGAKMEDCTADVIVSQLSPEQKKLLNMVSMPQMVWDCPSYFSSFMPGIETNVETTPKLKDLLDLVEKLKDEGPILVYSRYKEAQKCIYEELRERDYTCEIMNGETDAQVRKNLIDSFQLGDIKVLVTNVQKGLDFGNCNYCIFYDYDPNPNKMVQFEGRMTRERDIIGKHVYVLVSKGKELSTFKKTVADRAQASDLFAGSDYSCVLSLLLDNDKLKNIK